MGRSLKPVRSRLPGGQTRSERPFLLRLAVRVPRIAPAVIAAFLALPPGRLRTRILLPTVIEGVYGTFNRRERDVIETFAHPQMETIPARPFAELVYGHHGDQDLVLKGVDEGWDYIVRWLDVWEEGRLEPQEVVDLGDRILVLNHFWAHGSASGIQIDAETEAALFEFEGGRVRRARQFRAWDDALRYVGLDPDKP